MGTGGSFLRGHSHDEDDGLGTESSNGVIKRIPIEVKPRGKLGLPSVGSFVKKQKGGSLRSALSVELESAEVEKIRKEFEMYKLNKENELTGTSKKATKLETENKRLRAELKVLQKTCQKLRDERDCALDAEHQALVRAAAFESDRDKIQRHFKLFRETKESEIQDLLRNRRDLESKLAKGASQEDLDSRTGDGGVANPGDWWTALESEPSLGSTTQLHTPGFRGPEFAQSMMEMEGPFTNVNKDDWNVAAASLAHVVPTIPDSLQSNAIYIYVSAAKDVQTEVDIFQKEFCPKLDMLCHSEGRFLIPVFMPYDDKDKKEELKQEQQIETQGHRIEQATIFLAFLGEQVARYTEAECQKGHLVNPGAKPAVFCFREKHMGKHSKKEKDNGAEIKDLKKRVRESGSVKIVDSYTSAQQGAESAYIQIDKILKSELGIEGRRDSGSEDVSLIEQEGPEMLCGGLLWDPKHDFEQMEALTYSQHSTCELGFEKYYDRLHAHVSTPGPLPPLLISGASGSGKSLLLAKWIELQQQRSSSSLVLYHFVGSQHSCSADPVVMIRRITAQLMQHVVAPPALTCDPVRLTEEFPRWLEKVSAKLPGGIVLVLDGIDGFQQAEFQLKWLLDPLPVDTRVIVSAHDDYCPQAWRSWPNVYLEELTNKNVRELLRAQLASLGKSLSADHEASILTHCRTPSTCNPLYVVVLASTLARCSSEEVLTSQLYQLLETSDAVKLYKVVLELIRQEYETSDTRGQMKKILRLMCASRNGLNEPELFALVPGLNWNFWSPVLDALLESHILVYRSGLLIFAHHEAQVAVEEKYMKEGDGKTLESARKSIRDYFAQFESPVQITYRVADELPWVNKQLGDKEQLHRSILNLCVFIKLYGRGRCGEIISYWQYIGVDKATMAKAYYSSLKMMEGMVGQFDGLVTLPRIADVYEALGRFLRDLGLLSEAITPLQRALEIRETALDPDHPSVAQTLHQMAGLHAQWTKFPTAEALYKQALEIYEGAFGSEHYLVAKELDALAVLYQKQGKHELAEPLHRRAMSIRRKTKAPRVQSGQIRGVDPLRRRVLQLEELAMGPDSVDLARTLNELGVLYYLQNNYDNAESFLRRSLEMRESVLGNDHQDLAQSLNNLAGLYNDRKQYDKAESLYERALCIRKKHLPADHQDIASVINHLAVLYKKMGKYENAEPLYKQSVEIRERSFGVNHPAVATGLVNLAVLYSQQGQHKLALPLYERALKIYEDRFGSNHPRVAETLKNLALLKYEQGEYENAASLYKRATEIKESDPSYTGKVTSRRSSTADTNSTMKNILSPRELAYITSRH